MSNKLWLLPLFVLSVLLCLLGCSRDQDAKLVIAGQYGLAYAPIQIMEARGLLEKQLEGLTIEWETLGNTAAIREAIAADRVDIAFGGIPPYLIARDRGLEVTIFTGISQVPVQLVTLDAEMRTLPDLFDSKGIALPQPGSIQHILLSMGLQRAGYPPDYLDTKLVSLSHPDGMTALLSGGVSAHFTTPPYLFEEKREAGLHILLDGEQAFGSPFTFSVGYTADRLLREHPEWIESFTQALKEAISFLDEHPHEAASILSEVYSVDPEVLKGYLDSPQIIYSTDLQGVKAFEQTMRVMGYIQ